MFKKVNNEVMKNLLNQAAGKRFEYLLCQAESDQVYICIGGTRVHVIPANYCFFDTSKIKASAHLKKLFNTCQDKNTVEAYYTGTTITKDKTLYAEYKDSSGNSFYFNQKLIQAFGDISRLHMIVDGNSKYSPAVVKDNNNYIEYGIICPSKI